MEEELGILQETINQLRLARECMKDCDTVTTTEYNMFDLYIQELEDREIKLFNKVNGCVLEEV
jgi:hypothetical protein